MSGCLRIVVADDDPVFRALIHVQLQGEGHDVSLAADGEAALALAGAEPRPELVVLDVAMPVLDGLEVTRRLREQPETASLPIVLLTGRDRDADIVAGRQSGADLYIAKPLVIDQLRYFITTLAGDVEPPRPWDDTGA